MGIILLGSIFFMAGCTLNDPGISNSDPALSLQVEQNLSLIKLSWDQVKVTGFKEYILLVSTTDIPNSPTPEVNSETTVLKRIDDNDVLSYTVSNTLFAPRLCYKLYTSVDDRYLYSSTVCIDQDFTLYNGFNDRAGHETGLDHLVMFDRVNLRFSSLDYKSGEIKNTVDDNHVSFPMIEVSTLEGVTNYFAYDQSPPRLLKYSYPELSVLTSKDFSDQLYSVDVHKQFIYAAVDESQRTFQVINRGNLVTIDARNGLTGNRNLAVFDGDPVTVLEIGESAMMKYSINALGKITQADQILSGVSQLNAQNTTATNDQYFIGGRLGMIVNRNGEIISSLTTDINSFNTMNRFSPDGTKVVSIVNENIKTLLVISDISALPSVSIINSFEIPQASYADVIPEDHVIYLLGVTFTSGQGQTFLTKYPY